MVVMVSVAPPGGPAEGGEEMVTLADQKRNEKNKGTKVFEEDDDEFRPLVIDTRENNHSTSGGDSSAPTAMEQDKQRLLRQMSRDMALYRENNPSDTEEDLPVFNNRANGLQEQEDNTKGHHGIQDLSGTPSVFPGLLPQSDSSAPSSRVHSPALSTTSNSGGSVRSTHKVSHPQKARRKTDKILPVDGEKYVCPICHVEVFSNTELTKHIRSHNNGGPVTANSCTICGKVLSSQSSLDRHMLVHSGERPFKCKFCNMAFTTNGNMHRHMRIHEKEVCADGSLNKPVIGKEPVPAKSRYATTSNDPYSQVGFTSPAMKRIPHIEQPSSGSKRKLTFDMQQEELLNFSAKRRTLELMSNIRREFTILSPEGRAVNATTPSPPHHPTKTATNATVKQETKEGDDQQEFQCPVCGCSFLCRYGLESHLKTHPDFAFTCQLCPRTFSTRQDLIMHKFEEHKCSVLNNTDKPTTPGGDVAVGFHELDFIDFTCHKFPLIAEAWCGENVHCASSAFHDFTCKICQKAFPCQDSLRIHSNTHAQDNMSECKECEIHLPDRHAHANHMLKHIGQKVVTRVSQSDDATETPQKVVSKEDFLTCFGLAVSNVKKENGQEKEDSKKGNAVESSSSAAVVDPRHADRRINEEYFPMLQRMAHLQEQRRLEASQRQAEQYMALREQETRQHEQLTRAKNSNRDPESGSDLADIQQILSHFGSGGGLVHIGQSLSGMHSSPLKDSSRSGSKAFNPMVMHPESADVCNKEDGMRLPVMVTNNGFVPIQNRQTFDDSASSGSIETIQCKYCPEIFNNLKSHKIHERTHLGLAPYKCSQCTYSSADKSTLIRHLRTHNGERPFQCRLCSFAFTTKANCERHVRKKHMRFSKKDIDDVIGYNQYPTASTPEQLESFGSPDTICKYCGEDFKFFRALKHHLRSHSSCTRKPFTCRICESGFSTKANAVRHVQKHHPKVDQRLLEEQIFTNELLAAELAEETRVYESIEEMGDRSLSPVPNNGMARGTPTTMGSHGSSYSSPTPIVISPIPHNIPTPSANSMSGTYITSPPILRAPYLNEQQNPMEDEDQPLDFSMKSTSSSSSRPLNPMEQLAMAVVKIEQGHMSGGQAMMPCASSSDEPMDLTVKPSPVNTTPKPSTLSHSNVYQSSTSASINHQAPPQRPPAAMTLSDLPPEVAARALPQLLASKSAPDYGMLRYKKEYQKFYNPTVGRLQCPYCKMLFKHGLKLQVHIRSHTNERPFACAYCSASFTIKTNLERHLKTRHPFQPLVFPDVPAPQALEETPASSTEVGEDREVAEVAESKAGSASPSQGSRLQQAARSPRHSYGGSDDSNCDLSSVTKILDATNPNHFRSFFNAAEDSTPEPTPTLSSHPSPFSRYQEDDTQEDSSNHSSSNTSNRAGKEDMEDVESDGGDSDVILNQHQLSPEEIIRQTTENLPIIKIRNPKSAERGSGEDGSGSPAKKKRNSYADSPHKLMCPYCPRAFPWISSLNRHILTHTGQKPFKCPQCPVMFSTKSNRERHLVRKHGLNVLDPATRQMMDRPFKCHLCVFSSFSTGGNLTKHYTEKHPEHPVPEHLLVEEDANNNTDTYSAECRENRQVAEASKAKRLEFGDDDEDSKDDIQDGLGHKLMDHVTSLVGRSSRSSTPTPRSVSPAPPCTTTPAPPTTTTTTTTTATTNPTSTGTPDRNQQINPERDNYNVDKITECWKCEEDFGSRKGLLRHLKEHNIDLAFKCYLCDASYDQRLQCLDHMTQKHAADWTVLCEKNQVGDVSEFADCMNRIVEQNFIGNTGFGKKLTEAELAKYKVQLAEDMKPESDYAQRKVYCSLCPKRFWSLQDLRRHMRSHTGERPFECDLCQKRFTLKHSMMRHRRKHAEPGAASLSASDDEAGHGPEMTEQAFFNMQKKREVIARMAAEGDNGSLSAKFGSDLLHSMLGVEDATIDEMLNSYSADAAARVLGVQQ